MSKNLYEEKDSINEARNEKYGNWHENGPIKNYRNT